MTKPREAMAMTGGHQAAGGGREIPFDYAASTAMNGWRDDFAWPSDPRASRDMAIRQCNVLFKVLAGLDPITHATLAAAAGSIFAYALTLGECALLVQNAAARGFKMRCGPDEAAYLRGDQEELPAAFTLRPEQWKPPRAAALRRLKINWSISGWRGLAAMLRPETVLITRNSLQDRWLAEQRGKVAFQHPESILHAATRAYGRPRENKHLHDVETQLIDALVGNMDLRDPVLSRYRTMITQLVRRNLATAYHDVSACAAYPKLPRRIWSGTAGYYPSRVIGLGCMLAGGEAIRFDHGGPASLASTNNFIHAYVEDIAATTCILPSPRLADAARSHYQAIGGEEDHQVEFLSGGGDPAYLEPPARTARTSRRRVLYPPTLLSGFWQYASPDLPDIVNLDWQIRLAKQLETLSIDLTCKPHPEGILGNVRSPLEDVATVSYQSFESCIAETDLFVFDLMGSTTFWKALCTDRPVVYIDLGMVRFNELFSPMIERRCRIVRASYDANNLPYVDREELADAILAAPDIADPTEILEILGAPEYHSG
jgi:hypothetical protein